MELGIAHRRQRLSHWRVVGDSRLLAALAVLCVFIAAWLDLVLSTERVSFVVLAPTAKTGVEIILALTSLFGALVLLLFPEGDARGRLRWVAAGLIVLGGYGLTFGYVMPLVSPANDLRPFMYESLAVQATAATCWCVGFAARRVPRLLPARWVLILATPGVAASMFYAFDARLPLLLREPRLEPIALRDRATLGGLTGSYWALALVPLVLVGVAAVSAARRRAEPGMHAWLVIGMTLAAGAQVHALFWPTAFSPILTTASLLRIAFTVVIAIGGVVALRGVAAQRAALLREATSAARLKADFTAMVAHELSTPLAAIRRQADLLSDEPHTPNGAAALADIHAHIDNLHRLVDDAQAIATIERDEFTIFTRNVRLAPLLAQAATAARTLPGGHPVTVSCDDNLRVRADAQRIGQVLRNLLGNAAKYSPAGAPIDLSARADGGRARITVTDHGIGLPQEDMARVFEKFERGRDHRARQIGGAGLGLYLSRQIVRAHGAELTARDNAAAGATFEFWLEAA